MKTTTIAQFRLGLMGWFGVMGAIAVGIPDRAVAQIVPDASLGAESSAVTPDTVIRGLPSDLIDGGAIRGSNLFHSFQQFNIGGGRGAYFANPAGIENILSRVTGGGRSEILGRLGVLGNANLFLINPNGIVFGPNASLDVTGAFTATTANAIALGDQGFFSATQPESSSLLEIAPGALFFDQQVRQPRTIQNSGNLTAGRDLTLSADILELQGQVRSGGNLTLYAQDTLRIRDSVANPFIAAAGGRLLVQGDRAVDIFALSHPDSGLFSGGDMVLRSANRAGGDAHYWAGGNFRVEKLDGSLGGLFSPNDPVIRAAGNVIFDFYEGQSLHIFAGGSVIVTEYIWIQGADPINGLPAESVVLANGSIIPINGQQEATLDIRAGTLAVGSPLGLTGTNGQFGTLLLGSTPPSPSRADIQVGSIIFAAAADGVNGITTPLSGKVLLTNQYQPNPELQGSILVTTPANLTLPQSLAREAIVIGDFGSGGIIELHSKGNIAINGNVSAYPLPIFTGVVTGNGGNVTLRSEGDITLSPDSEIVARGIVGGKVTLTSKNGDVRLDRNQINSNSNNGDPNNGFSTIRIEAENGSVFINQSRVLAENSGTEFAGDIFIDARNRIEIDISQISARGRLGRIFVGANTSNPGDDAISPKVVVIDNNSSLETTNRVSNGTVNVDVAGFSGDIFLGAESAFLLNASQLTANTYGPDGTGRGNITVQTQFLSLTGGSEILSQTYGAGLAGDVTVKPLNPAVPSTVILSGVKPFTGFLRDQNGNLIPNDGNPIPDGGFSSGLFSTSEAGAINNGGTVNVTATNLNIENGAVVSARTRSSFNGGDVDINVQNLNISNGGQIVVSALDAGKAQNINVRATGTIDISGRDLNYNSRFQQIFSAFVNEFTSQNVNLQIAQQRAFVETQATVDPVSPYSGLQASELSGQGTAGSISISGPLIRMSDRALIEASTNGINSGGNIDIKAQTLSLTNGSVVLTQTTGAGKAGNITVAPLNPNVPSSITLSGIAPFVGIERDLLGNPFPDGGYSSAFLVSTEDLPPRPGFTVIPAEGDGGTITVKTDSLQIENGAVLSARTRSSGKGGDIEANVNTLDIIGGGQILTTAFSTGKAGRIEVNATGNISITGLDPDLDYDNNPNNRFNQIEQRLIKENVDPQRANELARFTIDPISRSSGLQAQALARDGIGSGDIIVRSRNGSISVSNSADLSTYTRGLGKAGDVLIEANGGSLSLDSGGNIFSTVESGGVADGGNIKISTGSVFMRGGSQLQTLLRGGARGNAGVISIQATDAVSLEGARTSILTTIEPGADGSTGDNQFAGNIFNQFFGLPGIPIGSIFIETDTLSLNNGALLDSSTKGLGNAGAVVVFANGEVTLKNGSSIRSTAAATSGDNSFAGGILLGAGSLSLERGSTITTQTENINGSAGLTFIFSKDAVRLDRQSAIESTTQSGNGGNIGVIATKYLLLRRDSNIRTDAGRGSGTGEGGNIIIRTPFIIAAPSKDNNITARAVNDRGGNVDVTAPDGGQAGLFGIRFRPKDNPLTNDITASSEFGRQGFVSINALDTTLVENNLSELSENFIDPNTLLANSCIVRNQGQNRQPNGTFLVTGSGGLPVRPGDPPPSSFPTGEVRSLPETQTNRPWQPGDPIIEPQGIYRLANGKLVMSRECEP